MKINTAHSQCIILLEARDNAIERDKLNQFALKILIENVQKLILKFEYGYEKTYLNLSLLFNSILQNKFIQCLSIQGPYYLNYNELKCLKNKNITLEFKYGINTNIKNIASCVKNFKSITHLELGMTNSNILEQQFIELLELLNHHPKLCSLVLPLPNNYSNETILILSKLLNIKHLNKFGISSPCNANDVLTIITNKTAIRNLGFTSIKDLTKNNSLAIFSAIKTHQELTHFTLHNWNQNLSRTLIEELGQLPHLESILLDCGSNIQFITEQLPDLIKNNLNLQSIELLHLDSTFTQDLNHEYIVYSPIYHSASGNPSLTNFRILQHEDCNHALFPDDASSGIDLLGGYQAVAYMDKDVINRNKIINDVKSSRQQNYLNKYFKNHSKDFNEAKIKPSHLEELRVPSLYHLSLQTVSTFFKQHPEQIKLFEKLPEEIQNDLLYKI